jgi:hypothetical protein
MTEEELMRTGSRRAFALGATGLFLPAAPAVLAAEPAADPETEGRRGRRRKHRKSKDRPNALANDTIIRFRNGANQTFGYLFGSRFHSDAGWNYNIVAPGEETGWSEYVMPSKLGTTAYLYIRTGKKTDPTARYYRITCTNREIGTPYVTIEQGYGDLTSGWITTSTIADSVDLGEGVGMVRSDQKWTFDVLRWDNGKESIDNYDEWYTRFFVTVRPS